MPFARHPRPETLKALAQVKYTPYWLDQKDRPEAAACLTGGIETDLLVIGAGFSGLWTALTAKQTRPERDVVLIDAGTAANAASGRNGGFVAASLTHGFENGLDRWPKELTVLTEMGRANLQAIAKTVNDFQIDCDFIQSGELNVATEEYQADGLQQACQTAAPYGERFEWLDREQIRAEVNSPLYKGALYNPDVAMTDPARLGWGLRSACLALGVKLYENTPAVKLEAQKEMVRVSTPYGTILARQAALATNAFPPLLKRLRHYIVPVYDYVLMTEPLSAAQRDEIGWKNRQGVGDAANQFHYYRTTVDGRILWGGYDAVYYRNNGMGPQFDVNHESFGRLAEHFFETFPQLHGLRFTHAWGGAIDTSSRFSPFWGTALGGKLAYSVGFTGLGVGSTRFGALVMLDLLEGKTTERTALEMVRTKPLPFPPEPARSAAINLTRWALDQADQNEGRRNLWLRTLDALGLGFDS